MKKLFLQLLSKQKHSMSAFAPISIQRISDHEDAYKLFLMGEYVRNPETTDEKGNGGYFTAEALSDYMEDRFYLFAPLDVESEDLIKSWLSIEEKIGKDSSLDDVLAALEKAKKYDKLLEEKDKEEEREIRYSKIPENEVKDIISKPGAEEE